MLDLDMAPYAAFVWSSWGISALALGQLAARALISARRWKRELEALEQADENGAQLVPGTIAPKG